MNLRSIDLNLLVILDALLDEAHVGRAADRLGLSQPAASSALQRCRYLFNDPLLERGRGNMRLTLKAEKLKAPLKSLLTGVHKLVEPAEIPLSQIRQTLRLSMADYPALFVLGRLHRELQATAPGIDLVTQPWSGPGSAKAALTDGTTDIAISVIHGDDSNIHRETVLDEHYVIAFRAGHPAANNFELDQWLKFPHILVSARGERSGALDIELAKMGRSRRVGLVVPGFAMVRELLTGSDMIAMLPSRVAALYDDIVIHSPPITVEGFSLQLAWHRRRANDTGLQHVARLLTSILSK